MCVMMAQNTWHITIITYMCVTMTQSTSTYCYHLIHVCHKYTKYIDTLLSFYTCVSQWHKVHLTHCYHLIHVCHDGTKYMTHYYHHIHVCHNDTKYTGTLLSSYTCVSRWHIIHWHIDIILYTCVTMTQSTLTHCCHLIHVCHNDTKFIGTLLSSYTCVSQWHKVQWHIAIILYMCVTMTQSTLAHCYHLIPVRQNDTKYINTKENILSG